MNVLLKSATIVDSSSDFHNQVVDILILNGTISEINKANTKLPNPTKNLKIVELDNLHVSPGWFDSSVSFGEPGYEERETIENGLLTAARSGFTAIALNPNTKPVIDSQADIQFVKSKALGHAVNLYPIGALTANAEGKELAELYDMKSAGAVAFYDYQSAIKDPNVIKLALQYASGFEGMVISFPQNSDIANNGVMNEEEISTELGLRGLPAMAEELQIVRDLFLLDYTDGKLHIPTISTAKSVELIKEAKSKNLNVSCSVAIHNLFYIDEKLKTFDTKYKVLPPLRTEKDRSALIEGLKDGTIDMVTSDHNPLDIERKKLEFDYADFGTIGLESAFGALLSIFSLKKTIDLLTRGKQRFNIDKTSIAKGNVANLTLFNPKQKYTFSKSNIHSASSNSIFLGEALNGKVYGIYSNNKLVL